MPWSQPRRSPSQLRPDPGSLRTQRRLKKKKPHLWNPQNPGMLVPTSCRTWLELEASHAAFWLCRTWPLTGDQLPYPLPRLHPAPKV